MLGISNIVEGPFRSANLGYWVARDTRAWHRDPAVELATRWAFDDRGLHRLEAGTLVDNSRLSGCWSETGFSPYRPQPPVPQNRRRVA